jgi:hypothetical protein
MRRDKPASAKPEDQPNRLSIRRAVRDLRALQQEIGKRNRFKPITDKEIKDALDLVADSSSGSTG